jgi:uncharacterized protein (DUF4415 family)
MTFVKFTDIAGSDAISLKDRHTASLVRTHVRRHGGSDCAGAQLALSLDGNVGRNLTEMAQPPRRPRTLQDARTEAEAAFKKTTTKPVEAPVAKAAVPGVRELVSLRIDQDVLEYFQQDGPGWQDRMNDALRKAAGK